MAQLFPKIENINNLKVKPTKGELQLLLHLVECLPDDVEVYFQPYLNGDMPDIILMKQHYGVTIIEVKDWSLDSYYINEDIEWCLKSNDKTILSPFKQAYRYKDNMFNIHINGLLEKKIENKYFYGRINVFVYFANATKEEINKLYDSHIRNVSKMIRECSKSDKKKLVYFTNKYNKIVKQRDKYSKTSNDIKKIILPNNSEQLFPDTIYKEFKRYLQPPFHTIEQGQDISYSKKQIELSISNQKHQKIKGVAGSGKTLILAKRAVNAHKRHGEKVLILTFNITMASYIHDMISNVRDNFRWDVFTIMNYHNYFNFMATNCELKIDDFADYDNEDFFENCELPKFDSVFIDEIQDYNVYWIRIIKKYFLKSDGELVVFGDEKQNIYDIKLGDDKKPNTTITGAWNALNESFRLGKAIAKFAEKFQSSYFTNKYDIDRIELPNQLSLFPVSNIIKYKQFDHFELKEQIFWIFDFIKSNNIHPNDICIISGNIEVLRNIDYIIRNDFNENTLTTFETEEIRISLQKTIENKEIFKNAIDNLRKVKKYGFRLNSGVLKLSTVHSFKGWEAPTIFLLIGNDSDETVYTGITRARENLIIISNRNDKHNKFFLEQAGAA